MNWGGISIFLGLLCLAFTSPWFIGVAIVGGLAWLFFIS